MVVVLQALEAQSCQMPALRFEVDLYLVLVLPPPQLLLLLPQIWCGVPDGRDSSSGAAFGKGQPLVPCARCYFAALVGIACLTSGVPRFWLQFTGRGSAPISPKAGAEAS